MVAVKARSDSFMPSLTFLGLANASITVRLDYEHRDMHTDAWGMGDPDMQQFNGGASVQMNLIHYDREVMRECWRLSMGAPGAEGMTGRAGLRMGNNLGRFAPAGTVDLNGVVQPGNNFIGLNIFSPVDNMPWRFWYAYLQSPPFVYPLGTEKSVVSLNWRACLYTVDPWGGGVAQPFTNPGTGSLNAILWDHTLDT